MEIARADRQPLSAPCSPVRKSISLLPVSPNPPSKAYGPSVLIHHSSRSKGSVPSSNVEGSEKKNKYSKTDKGRTSSRCEQCSKLVRECGSDIVERVPWGFYDQLVRRYKEFSNETRSKVLFLFASVIGTALFVILFECLLRINSYNLEQPEVAFTLSYIGAYMVSIVWQHALNRVFVFSAAPYCSSLLHTYIVYSFSLMLMAASGNLLVKYLGMSPRIVALLSLVASGVLNYQMLAYCMPRRGGSAHAIIEAKGSLVI